MIVLDENIRQDQADFLKQGRIAVRKIGCDLAIKGTGDADIVPLLLKLKQPTFFTQDKDFWKLNLRHEGYCLAYLDIPAREAALYIKLLLRNPLFDTSAKRLGKVMHIHKDGISFYSTHSRKVHSVSWRNA
jgi:hypothetical protein